MPIMPIIGGRIPIRGGGGRIIILPIIILGAIPGGGGRWCIMLEGSEGAPYVGRMFGGGGGGIIIFGGGGRGPGMAGVGPDEKFMFGLNRLGLLAANMRSASEPWRSPLEFFLNAYWTVMDLLHKNWPFMHSIAKSAASKLS